MPNVRRYLFDDDFDPPKPAVAALAAVDDGALRAHEDRLRSEGFAAGRAAALEDAAVRGADAVERLAVRLSLALDEADALVQSVNEDAAELAIAAANLLAGPAAPPALAAHTAARLTTIIAEQIGVPFVTVSVAPHMQPHVQAAADHVVGSANYTGRLTVVVDDDLTGCDLVIDWQTGALHECRRDRLAALAGKIREHFALAAAEGETSWTT